MTETKKTTDEKKAAPRRRPAAPKAAGAAVVKRAPAKEPHRAAPRAKKEESGEETKIMSVAPKTAKAKVAEKPTRAVPAGEYIYALGRRKSAIAQTRLYHGGKGVITANGLPAKEYFKVQQYVDRLYVPLKAVGLDNKVNIDLRLTGGGLNGQSDAAMLGISRALVKDNEEYRPTLKKMGLMTRDPREKERKKYGLKKARKGPQWA
ncbi:MAG: 30S ribosomal protein S9, partial [Patescibacteria group bacterium]|nr:30S ribosomal protein S9 [Patescibacteria group bacterium]